MAKRSRLDSYLASTRTAIAPAPNPNTLANALARDGAPTMIVRHATPPIAEPVIASSDAAVDDAAARGRAVTLRAEAHRAAKPGSQPAILHRASIDGIGQVAIVAHADGSCDRAIAATGQAIAKYRRAGRNTNARRWWPCRDVVTGAAALAMLRALESLVPNDAGAGKADDGDAAATLQCGACARVGTNDSSIPAHAPSCDRTTPPAAVAAAPMPETPASDTLDDYGASLTATREPAPKRARARSFDPNVCHVIDHIVCPNNGDAEAIRVAMLAALRDGSADPVTAWSASAWVEGAAMLLVGDRLARALAAATALRDACAEHLRIERDRPRGGISVDDVMGAIGGVS